MRARAIAAELVALARPESRGISWIAEDPNLSSADLMVGYGGVLHFLSRLIRTGAAHGFPLLLDPAA
jgi:hypothetical protein